MLGPAPQEQVLWRSFLSCPHGHGPPVECSQCLGASAKRVEQIEPGLWAVDDVIVERRAIKNADYGTVQTTRAVSRCEYCRKAGHKTENCKERIANETMAASYLGAPQIVGKKGN